jgi:hypothetical protein
MPHLIHVLHDIAARSEATVPLRTGQLMTHPLFRRTNNLPNEATEVCDRHKCWHS